MGKVTVPFLGMIIAEFAQVGLIILSKQVMAQGMTSFIFIFYSNAIASLILLPSSFLIHRSQRPPITFSILSGFFLLGVLGLFSVIWRRYLDMLGFTTVHQHLAQPCSILFLVLLSYLPFFSASVVSLLNIIRGLPNMHLVHYRERMEKLDWGSSSSLAKSLGTIVSIAGAFIATLYKGAALLKGLSPANSIHKLAFSQDSSWILGGLCLAADCVMASAYIIVQASILKKYPAELICVFFYCFSVTILSAITCLVVERDISAWSVEPKFKLLSVLYSGIIGSAFQVGVSTWCLHQTGPVFVSMFKPIGIVISVFIGVIFLGDVFYLGSLVGAAVIVVGFYAVLWGKSKDIEMRSLESRGKQTPLLNENSSEDV